MNEEIKAQWLAALRSDKYEQGMGYLKINGKYCCLGVLCDLAKKAGIVTETVEGNVSRFRSTTLDSDTEISVLPVAVRNWAGLVNSNPGFYVGEKFTCLSVLNDGETSEDGSYQVAEPMNFAGIADMIEEHLHSTEDAPPPIGM